MSWTAALDGNTGKWTFHDMSNHPYIDTRGRGEVVHGFATMAEAMEWATERSKTLAARAAKGVS
jgi:hypothetical protein